MSNTDAYLDLLKLSLTDGIHCPRPMDPQTGQPSGPRPERAHTMLSIPRLELIQHCIEEVVVVDPIPGDMFQAGVWRGGAAVFMALATQVYRRSWGCTILRKTWAADSFCGFPPPKRKEDKGFTTGDMSVDRRTVQHNFGLYGASDLVDLWHGYFSSSLPKWRKEHPDRKIAVLHIDGDMYDSTMDCLENLYWRVPIGGYVIIDDYGAHKQCRDAVEDFRVCMGIVDEPVKVDWTAVYWRKSSHGS